MMWEVHPHGELQQLHDDLWIVEGSLPRSPLPRNMLLYRLPGGRLLVYSAVALDAPGMEQLEGVGRPDLILIPNALHRLQAAAYKERYPEARVICPGAARSHVEKLVPVDDVAEEALPPHGVRCHQPPGIRAGELVYELPLGGDGVALLFTDLLFHLPRLKGASGCLLHLVGSTGFFGLTRIGRWLLKVDRPTLKGWLLDQAKRDDVCLAVVAHGPPITSDVGPRLAEAAHRLG